jgi:glucosamine-phosphate N-acetyltransferase
MDYIIRPLEESDYDSYLEFINNFCSTFFTIQQFSSILRKIHNNSTIWIIEYNKNIIATATILYEYKLIHNIVKLAHIEDVFIDEDWIYKGIGKMLIEHLIEEANKKNCYKIILDCKEELEYFYKRTDLEKTGIQMSKYIL